jgi:type VI secretion system protein VasD
MMFRITNQAPVIVGEPGPEGETMQHPRAAGATRRAADRRRFIAAGMGLAAALVAATLSGCGSDPKPKPKTTAEVKVKAAPTLNPDLNGRPSPVVVRFYQLLSPDMFQNADFFQLFEQEQAALGPTSVGKDEFVIEPGQITTLTIPIKADVKNLGVVVAYRNYDKATWRAVVPIKQDNINPVDLQALGQIVQMTATGAYSGE